MPKTLFLIGCLLCTVAIWAQSPEQTVEMADAMRQSGKIYVVIACILLIFIGIVLFLFNLERRIKKLENDLK